MNLTNLLRMDDWLNELLQEGPKPSFLHLLYVDELIRKSILCENQKCALESQISEMNMNELLEITSYLLDHQPEPIANGLNYSQTDIRKKLSQLDD